MRRGLIVVGVGVVALLALVGPVAAGRPDASCPNAASGFSLVDQQAWWDTTVAGFEAEGIDVYPDGVVGNPRGPFTTAFDAFAVAFGFEDGLGLYDFIWGPQWQALDKNDDLLLCMKQRTVTPGQPAYYLNGIDNTAH